MMEYPVGVKFLPRDDEIILNYLLPKILGSAIPCDHCIVEERIYSVLPSSLNWNRIGHLVDHERYYYVKRCQASTKLIGDDINGVGFWRASPKVAILDSQNRIIGFKVQFDFFIHADDRRYAVRSRWLMNEFSLADVNNDFEDWVICRVKDKEIERNPNLHYAFNINDQVLVTAPPQKQAEPPQQENISNDDQLMTYTLVQQSDYESLEFYVDSSGELFVCLIDTQPPFDDRDHDHNHDHHVQEQQSFDHEPSDSTVVKYSNDDLARLLEQPPAQQHEDFSYLIDSSIPFSEEDDDAFLRLDWDYQPSMI